MFTEATSLRTRQSLRTVASTLTPLFPFIVVTMLFTPSASTKGQAKPSPLQTDSVPSAIHLQILQAEDERRWDNTLSAWLTDKNPSVRARAALAAGRIGNEQAIPALSSLLQDDKDQSVRAMAAFAIGEIESAAGADPLISIIKNTADTAEVRGRAIEGLGKIAAALPREQEARARELGATILESLRFEGERASPLQIETILMGLTATLRARPTNAGPVLGSFLRNRDPRVRADALNALARLRAKEANSELRTILTSDVDPVVRANAARVLGATDEQSASDALLDRAVGDSDLRVRVSAIRALASVKYANAVDSLLKRSADLISEQRKAKSTGVKNPAVQNELLEIATTLGRLLPLQSQDNRADEKSVVGLFAGMREVIEPWAPEVEIAFVRVLPSWYIGAIQSGNYPVRAPRVSKSLHWRSASSLAQAMGEVASLPDTVQNKAELLNKAQLILRDLLDNSSGDLSVVKAFNPDYAIPDILRALALHKPKDFDELLRLYLNERDVVVRSTAADLLGDLPASEENTKALIASLAIANNDELNDAALSILDSLGKQKTKAANEILKSALQSKDMLIRRRAAALLKTNGLGDFASSLVPVKTTNTRIDYERALARSGRSVQAIVTTSKGSFTIELLPSDAPLTVDNFIRLAQRGYFRGITIHRVVPNFVIQDGDPRGDGNGGPGYQIRCEVNQMPYDRAAVGMALSGKDTGGSQWFVTHSRQPHLDGGYTVFGRVASGMDVVDNIVRGDVIQSITIKQR
jgi:cyclophilin family peptidyl-prolyl cis-trans isomerase/HEAT repeat protein